MKKLVAMVLVLALAMSVAALSGAVAEESKKAAMVTSQKLGDNGVTDLTHKGFMEGCEAFGFEPTVIEVEAGEYEETLRALCEEGYDFIMPCWSAMEDACATVAGEYPDSKFVMVFSEIEIPNVVSLMSRQEDGSYLAGVAAAKTCENAHIGFIGGSDNPQINKFLAGYKQGALSVNPDIKVDVAWVGSFEDPAKGKELALMLYDQGCEIIFVAAASSSNGVFEAATEANGKVIGCDVDQSEMAPGHVIGSMVINYDQWVYQCLEAASKNEWKFGVIYYSIPEVDYRYPAEATFAVAEDVKTAVSAASEGIQSGEIKVAPVCE